MQDPAVIEADPAAAGEPVPRQGLTVVPDEAEAVPRYEDEAGWEEQGRELASRSRRSEWQILWGYADWIVAAERDFDGEDKKKRPDRYTKASEISRLGYGRCRNLACTARAFKDVSRRRDKLSFAHHTVVARRADADTWLAKAEEEGWNEKTLRLKMQAENGLPPKGRPKRIVLSATPEWERAAKVAGSEDVKAWLTDLANREVGLKADDSGEEA